jgi:hypothetical protein
VTPAGAAARETFDDFTAKRRELEALITSAAIQIVRDWMADNDVDELEVDDENVTPSYARIDDDICEDDTLNEAISWLPRKLIVNSTPNEGWNPVVRSEDLQPPAAGTVRQRP